MSTPNIKHKSLYCYIAIFVIILLSGCSSEDSSARSGDTEVLVKINNSIITLEEFNELIKFEADVDPELDLTAESRNRFLEYLIRKELMIQEASRLKLNRKKVFIRTIERYWESTLIRNLLDQKTKEFKRKILITEDDIKTYYSTNKSRFDHPLEVVRDEIRSILESKELEKQLEQWTMNLRKSAKIEIKINMNSP
jgi:hypothetical protein